MMTHQHDDGIVFDRTTLEKNIGRRGYIPILKQYSGTFTIIGVRKLKTDVYHYEIVCDAAKDGKPSVVNPKFVEFTQNWEKLRTPSKN